MSALLSYEFGAAPVRVLMIEDDPWFVANDVAKVLGYRDAANMARNLDDDEKGTHIVSTPVNKGTHNVRTPSDFVNRGPHNLRNPDDAANEDGENAAQPGGPQLMSIISESGLYHAIFVSRRPEAQAFRRWVTGTVLPELRRTGRFAMLPPEQIEDEEPPMEPARITAAVSAVREARRLFGAPAARRLWPEIGLPGCARAAEPELGETTDPFALALADWLNGRTQCTIAEALEGLGERPTNRGLGRQIGKLLRAWGWTAKVQRISRHRTAHVFTRSAA